MPDALDRALQLFAGNSVPNLSFKILFINSQMKVSLKIFEWSTRQGKLLIRRFCAFATKFFVGDASYHPVLRL